MENKSNQISPSTPQLLVNNIDINVQNSIPVCSITNMLEMQIQQSKQNQNDNFQKTKKREYNEKQQKKKSGLYQATLLEQAKDLVKKEGLDIAELTFHDIWKQLSSEEKKSMKKFFVNVRQKDKKSHHLPQISPETKLSINQEQQNMISNIQVRRNELISKDLSACQSIENQIAVMIQHNRQNHVALFDFLKSLQYEPFENFFEVLIKVIQVTEDCSQQIRLLVGLCGLYNGQKMSHTRDLSCLALKYLANEDGVTSQQAIGFLKFTFVTNGDLHSAELSDLLLFDQRHKQCFVGFKQWLQITYRLPHDLTMVLPNSCYILGLPFAKRLKTKSHTLTQHVSSQFLEIFIQILVFSFEKENCPFKFFLKTAQNGFLQLPEKIITTQFLNIFNALLKEVTTQNKQWYMNITNSSRLIEGTLKLIKENKISCFNSEVCENLLLDPSNIDSYIAAPSLIKNDFKQGSENQFRLFFKLNQDNLRAKQFFELLDISKNLPKKIFDIFDTLQIFPHFIQQLAMQILTQSDNTHLFLNIAPGLGKTKLILASAINFYKEYQIPVFVLNPNKVLSDRDFQQAKSALQKLQISSASVISQQAAISFLSIEDFISSNINMPVKYKIILDEYQNVFFNPDILSKLEFLKQATTFLGFSGSPLISTQVILLQECFGNQTLVLQLTPPTNIQSQDTIICKSQSQHIKELSKISEQFRYKVPQVFILDPQTTTALIKGKKKQPYVSLFQQDPQFINTTLSKLFNQPRDDGTFGTFIINEEMGTGTDFKTSTDIEDKGGLVLVYGIKPNSTSTFEQLSCRVGRIFNKSRRLYIIQDSDYVGSSKDYLKFQLEMIKQKEDTEARELLNKLRKYNDKHNKNNLNDNDHFLKDNKVVNTHNSHYKNDTSYNYEMINEAKEELKQEDIYIKQCTRCDGQVDGQMIHTCCGEMSQVAKQTQQIGKKRIHNQIDKFEEEFRKEGYVIQQTKRQKTILSKQQQQQILPENVKISKETIDKLYFEGYSEKKIHKEMVNDKIRVGLFQKAIQKTCKGKVVLDFGCGSGILSVQAIKAGAIKVYAIDAADVTKIMNNDFKQLIQQGKIEFIQSTIENLIQEYDSSLTNSKIPLVDVIVSEWMGYFLLFENMISSFILAIKNFLKPDGIILPSLAQMYLQIGCYENKISNKYLNPFENEKPVMIKQFQSQALLSEDATNIKVLDFDDKNLDNPLDCADGFTSSFTFTVNKPGKFNTFIGSFEVKLCEEVFLNTMPASPETHWKQALFFVSNPIQVEIGDTIEGEMQIQVHKQNYRNLAVKITYKVEGKGGSENGEWFAFP